MSEASRERRGLTWCRTICGATEGRPARSVCTIRLWPWIGGGVCAKTRSDDGDGTGLVAGSLFTFDLAGKPARARAVWGGIWAAMTLADGGYSG